MSTRSPQPFLRRLVQALLPALVCAPLLAQEQSEASVASQAREAERGEIVGKRAVIERQRVEAEKLCYQQFAVEDCLAEARRAAREKDAPLRARELQLNDAERKEKAAQRLQAIEAKKAENAAAPMKTRQRVKKGETENLQAQRDDEARQRAAGQAERVRRHEQERARAQQSQAEREAQASADYEAKTKAAAERKARAQQKAAERGKTAAPLPAPAP